MTTTFASWKNDFNKLWEEMESQKGKLVPIWKSHVEFWSIESQDRFWEALSQDLFRAEVMGAYLFQDGRLVFQFGYPSIPASDLQAKLYSHNSNLRKFTKPLHIYKVGENKKENIPTEVFFSSLMDVGNELSIVMFCKTGTVPKFENSPMFYNQLKFLNSFLLPSDRAVYQSYLDAFYQFRRQVLLPGIITCFQIQEMEKYYESMGEIRTLECIESVQSLLRSYLKKGDLLYSLSPKMVFTYSPNCTEAIVRHRFEEVFLHINSLIIDYKLKFLEIEKEDIIDESRFHRKFIDFFINGN